MTPPPTASPKKAIKTIFKFIGVSDFHELFAEGMDHAPESAPQIMSDAIEQAILLGKTF